MGLVKVCRGRKLSRVLMNCLTEIAARPRGALVRVWFFKAKGRREYVGVMELNVFTSAKRKVFVINYFRRLWRPGVLRVCQPSPKASLRGVLLPPLLHPRQGLHVHVFLEVQREGPIAGRVGGEEFTRHTLDEG